MPSRLSELLPANPRRLILDPCLPEALGGVKSESRVRGSELLLNAKPRRLDRGNEVKSGNSETLKLGGFFGGVGVVVLADFEKAVGEAVEVSDGHRHAATWDAVRSGLAFIDEIESGEQQQGLVRSLMWRAFLHRGDAGVEVVEAFDGEVQCHADRQAIGRGGGKENRGKRVEPRRRKGAKGR